MAQNPFYVDPGNDLSQGLTGLSGILLGAREQQQRQALMQQRMDAEAQKQQRFEQASAAAAEAFKGGDPEKIALASIQYPEIAEALKMSTGLKSDLQNQSALGFTRSLALADPASRPAIYEARIKEIEDRGGDATHTKQSYQDYQANPEAEARSVISYWAGIDPKGYQAFADERKAESKESLERLKMDREDARFARQEAGADRRAASRNAATRSAALAGAGATAHMKDFRQYQELKNTDPEAAKAFGQAAGFVSKEGKELSPQAQKRLSTAIDSAVQAENTVGKLESLADQISGAQFTGGVAGNISEKIKELTGSQDAVTELRKEAYQARASQAMANLPPGAASDADVKIAFSPMPTDNASPEQWANWLRVQAKVQKINADFHNFKADYVSENGTERGMLQAWKGQGNGRPGQTGRTPPDRQLAPASAPADGGWRIVE